jgi:hypothetical protein
MAVTPGWKFSAVLSAKDLNPRTVRFFKYMIFAKVAELLVSSKGKNTIYRAHPPASHN